MDWREQYKEREITPKKAVELIHPGDKIFLHTGCSEPQEIIEELCRQNEILKDIEIHHFLSINRNISFKNKPEDLFRYNAFFIADDAIREAVNEGQADYTPMYLSEIPQFFKKGRKIIDVALIQVSPPDKNGFCSFGVNVDVAKPIAESANLLIAEINPNVPRTIGNTFIPMKKIQYFIYSDHPLLELSYGPPDEVDQKIAKYTASLIRNGATLQVGLGHTPYAVLAELKGHKNLGIHTDCLFEGYLDLIESGVITCSEKTIHQNRIVANYALGTKRLFEFVNDNLFLEFHPSDYTNNPLTIAQNPMMTAINSALSVDLLGQVNTDSIGSYFYSGIGGLVDFARGANMSKDGMSIILLRSTAKNSTISRIVSSFPLGTHVSLTMADVHYIVTEWGVAYLHGKNIRERVMALISIAHPKFRKQLLEEAKKMRLIYSDQKLATDENGCVVLYPAKYEIMYETPQKEKVFFRPILPTDERMVQDLYYALDDESRIFRFFRKRRYFNRQEIDIHVDYENEFVIVGLIGDLANQKIIAMGSYERNRESNFAEIAFTVDNSWRNKGLTKFMVNYLIRIAREKGLDGFQGATLWDNKTMVHIIKSTGYEVNARVNDEDWIFSFRFNEKK
jgi:acyl-CoA hydrolase